jgi:shikimate kinase
VQPQVARAGVDDLVYTVKLNTHAQVSGKFGVKAEAYAMTKNLRNVPRTSHILASPGTLWTKSMIRLGLAKRNDPAMADNAARVAANLGSRSIVLVGLMGCGKTSVGRKLSQRLGIPFVDADEEIEQAANKTIKEIFDEHGENYFRAGERRVIARLLNNGPQVLATGGGAFMSAETRDAILRSGISIWLKADLPILMRRVMKRSNRPLLHAANPESVMRDLMTKRYPIYAGADITVTSREVPHDAMADDVIAALHDCQKLMGAQPPTTA